MGRLTGLKPTVGRLAPRVGYAEGDEKGFERQRRQTHPYRAWYNTARWRALRMAVLVRDHFTCRMCGRLEGNTSLLVGDHIIPHKGNEALFWDETNVQCVCKSCHDGAKQAFEKQNPIQF